MQRKLSLTAQEKPEHKFGDLYSLLCNEVWLRVAAHNTLQNSGSTTAGIDGMTKANFLGNFDGQIIKLKEALKAKTLEPMPVRRVYIPKPNSEKKRPLGIPMSHAYCLSLQRRLGIAVVAPTSMNAIDQLTQYNELGEADQVSSGKNRSESVRITSKCSGLLTSTPTACFSVNDGLVGQTLMAVQSCHARRRYSWPFTS
jgi:hypothetical protein